MASVESRRVHGQAVGGDLRAYHEWEGFDNAILASTLASYHCYYSPPIFIFSTIMVSPSSCHLHNSHFLAIRR